MKLTRFDAHQYLAAPQGSFWRWSDDGSAVVWHDGATIAFAEEVRIVLARLAPRGLPIFESVLLTLACCRDSWGESSRELGILHGFLRASSSVAEVSDLSRQMDAVLRRVRGRIGDQVQTAMLGLNAVAGLPGELRRTPAGKAAIAEFILDAAPRLVTGPDAEGVLRLLDHRPSRGSLFSFRRDQDPVSALASAVDALGPGMRTLDAERIRLRARTGLDHLVEQADLDLPIPDRIRALLRSLRGVPEHAGLASLALDLMAVAQMPRRLDHREDLPTGGFSDLVSRGPLDRLLPSELANDDLTLAVRIAMGEALYLEREWPLVKRPTCRAILIDCGIRMWGIPRVIAAATALALAATADRRGEVKVYRAVHRGIEPVDLRTREGLESLLAALEADPHPGDALDPFLDALGTGPEASIDAVVITHEDALADPDFRIVLPASSLDLQVAAVDARGSFRLVAIGKSGRKELRRARLSLAGIYPPAPQVAPLRDDLPAIFSREPFPILLPLRPPFLNGAVSPTHGLLAITRDRRIIHCRDHGHGFRVLLGPFSNRPRGKTHGIFMESGSSIVAATIGSSVIAIDLDGPSSPRTVPVDPSPSILSACRRGGVLFLVRASSIEGISLGTLARLQPLPLERGMGWRSGRFFKSPRGHFALGSDGMKVVLEHIQSASRSLMTFFDRTEVDGPWELHWDWTLVSPNDGPLRVRRAPKTAPLKFLGALEDGQAIAVRDQLGGIWTFRFSSASWISSFEERRPDLLRPWDSWPMGPSLASKFDSLRVDEESLVLLRKGHERLRIDKGSPGLQLTQLKGEAGTGIPFSSRPLPPGAGFGLQEAALPDGSKVFLDSRGLLHLRSSDPSLPEMSLVLSFEQPLTVWTAGGRTFGSAYFLPDPPDFDPGAIHVLFDWFLRSLR